MLTRFIPERWQRFATKNAAPSKSSPDDLDLLAQQLLSDDVALRRAALTQTDDLLALQRLMQEDGDAGVRECAQARLCKLIEGGGDVTLPLDARQAALQAIITPVLAERFALKAAEPALRILALHAVERPEFCAERAIADPVAKVREAALERVNDADILATIARRTRKSDKHISRHAKQRSQALAAEQQRQETIERLCTEIETLPWDGETGANAARFALLEQQWQSLSAEAATEQQQRFQQAREQFQTRLRLSAAQRQQRLSLCQQLDALLAQLQTPLAPESAEASAESPSTARQLEDLIAQWPRVDEADDPESRRLQRYFEEQCALVRTQEQRLAQQQRWAEQWRHLCQQGERLLQHSGRLSSTAVKRFEQDGQALLGAAKAVGEWQGAFKQTMAALQRRLVEQDAAQAVEHTEITECLAQLEQALDAGELQHAISLQERAQQQLASNRGLSQAQMSDFQQRLQALAPRIGQLRDWRRWGTNRSRESLIEAVEQLIDSGLPPSEQIKQIQQAREHWKLMDHTGGHAPRVLWRQFDQACERAYAPVRVWREQQAAERQEHLNARIALCEQLEQFLEGVDTQTTVDWRGLSRFEQKLRQQWQQVGPVERRQHKVIERRYLAGMKRLQGLLQPILEQELARRRGLIEQAEALLDAEDHARAADRVKRLQAEWQPQVLASRRQEQALWKQFRAACDAVFERHQAGLALQRAEQQARRQSQESLLLALEQLIEQLPQIDLSEADERFATLRNEWMALTTGISERGSDRRFSQANQRFQSARESLARRSELDEILRLPAPDAAQTDTVFDLNAHQQRCLQLEILLGLESPAEFAEARLQFRVAQLSEALGEREQAATGRWSQILALLRENRLSSLPDDPAIVARWQRIMDAARAQCDSV